MAFHHYELRTTDLDSARAFYEVVLAGPFDALLTELPAAARAQGAPAHWLGHLFAGALRQTLATFLAAGATPLGPERETDDNHCVIGLRDPFGAVVALTDREEPCAARARPIHLSASPAAARSLYALDADFVLLDRPGTHPQWLFPIVVRDVAETVRRIRTCGGRADPMPLRDGFDFAACEDPQGAAFAVLARASR